jgi:hypothetical protein
MGAHRYLSLFFRLMKVTNESQQLNVKFYVKIDHLGGGGD